MKTIYLLTTDFGGECQGVFDDKKRLLDAWSLNDACFRPEYMSGFLKKLGFNVEHLDPNDEGNRLLTWLVCEANGSSLEEFDDDWECGNG